MATTTFAKTACLCLFIAASHLFGLARCRKKDILKSSTDLLDKESSRLQRENVQCGIKSISIQTLDEMRSNTQQLAQKLIACHAEYLSSNKEEGWAWSSLGTVYQRQGSSKYSSLANNCFKQAAKLDGNLSKHVKKWFYIGPFVIGKGEVDGDPLEAYGGIRKISSTRLKNKKGVKFISELGNNGHISWQIYPQTGDSDMIQITPHVNWNDLVNSLGSTGITEWQGWIVGEFALNGNNVNVVMQCQHVHTVFVDDIPIVGDVYRRTWLKFSISLSKGIHTIYSKLRGKGPQPFICKLSTASSAFEILTPLFLPDLYDGFLFSGYISLPISNYQSSKWLKNIKISIEEQPLDAALDISQTSRRHLAIAPGQTRPVNFQITSEKDMISATCSSMEIKLKISTTEGIVVYPIKLRCRKKEESVIFTFLDHDGSVQHAAAIRPMEECANRQCPILLTLHGTTVPAQNQADSYKRMQNGHYVFGLDRAWLVAPTRHGAHNWEGPGALTALKAVEVLAELTTHRSWLESTASKDHIIIAGHSMGGHGAWHVGTHYPDQVVALISLAGWIKKEEYGDSNLFFRHDISTSYVDPAVKYFMEACIHENDADQHVSNLYNIPILARIGANDRTIHPFLVRRMYRVIMEWGLDVSYTEIPNKEHWWWDTVETNDGGCVNDQQLREFTNKHSYIPGSYACDSDDCANNAKKNKYSPDTQMQEKFTFIVKNPALGGTMRGLYIIQQLVPLRTSKIEVIVNPGEIYLETTNVKRLSIKPTHLRPLDWHGKQIKIDENKMDPDATNIIEELRDLSLCREGGVWSVCSNDTEVNTPGRRGPENFGPARRIAESPFIIVIGTQGDDLEDKVLRELGVYIANLFFITSEAIAPVVKDVDVTDELSENHNIIIIGGPRENSITQSYLDSVPLSSGGGIILGNCIFKASNTGALFLAPHSINKLALVLLGNSLEGLRDIVSLASPTIPPMTRSPFSNLLPDLVITGPGYRARGPGGYLCAGIWGNEWELRADLISCAHCLQ